MRQGQKGNRYENRKKLLVIDGQGGRMGAALVSQCKAAGLDAQVIAVGANSAATTRHAEGRC